MELFVVKNRSSHEVLKVFNNKLAAKVFRKEINPKEEGGEEIMQHVVSLGKDHDKYISKKGDRYE
jgi:hypothetical protein